MSERDTLFQPTLFERLRYSGRYARVLHARLREDRRVEHGVDPSAVVRGLRFFGFRSNHGLKRLDGERIVAFEVFPSKDIEELRTTVVDGFGEIAPFQLADLFDLEIREGLAKASSGALSASEVREAIIRDLTHLLETTSYDAAEDLTAYEEVASSVLNYGVRGVFGMLASRSSAMELGDYIRTVIERFEPRIDPGTLRVRCRLEDMAYDLAAVGFEIEGDFWGQPLPEHLRVLTQFEIDTQRFGDPTIEVLS